MEATILEEPLPYEERIKNIGSFKYVDVGEYFNLHRKSLEDYESFWASVARELEWFKPFEKIVEPGDRPNVYRWFSGGLVDIPYLALDRNVKGGRRNKLAYI